MLYSHVRVIDAPAHLSHKELREIGANAASGDIVVLLDDERLLTSSMERQFPMTTMEWEDGAQQSSASLTRWLNSMAVSAHTPAASEPSISRPRTLVASWRNVAALLVELSRFRLLRTTRATRG
jgi:hypothetical protein